MLHLGISLEALYIARTKRALHHNNLVFRQIINILSSIFFLARTSTLLHLEKSSDIMASSPRPTNLMQTLIHGPYSLVKIPTITINISDLDEDMMLSVFGHVRPIGISPGYSKTGALVALAIADDQNCRIIEFNYDPNPRRSEGQEGRGRGNRQPVRHNPENLRLLQDIVLCRQAGDLFAFDMGPLAMSLYSDIKLRVTNAVDIQSGISAVDRKPICAIMDIVGSSIPIEKENIRTVFRNPIYDQEDRNRATDLAMRAWVSQFLADFGNGAETFAKVPKIDTVKLPSQVLEVIGKVANDAHRLDQMKPTQTMHQVSFVTDSSTGGSRIQSTTFKDRVRWNKEVRLNVNSSKGKYVVPGQTGQMVGKATALESDRSLSGKDMSSTLISIGRDDPTTAEALRAATVLRILQGSTELLEDSPWIKNIWFPADDFTLSWPEEWSSLPLPPNKQNISNSDQRPSSPMIIQPLNQSQQEAVNTMYSLDDTHRITIVQGPPGTGKTSVIAAYVQLAIEDGSNGIWLVAQSNVAVKNIAEKLMKVGFLDWKLLVSKDFHFEWHEHLYTRVKSNVIISDEFMSLPLKEIRGCKVMLCTLSMLSNHNLGKFTRLNPIKTLIVDEASQIEIGAYIPVFSKYSTTIRKACFIGDDKQLPPYGQEDLQDLQSIFEIPHLRMHGTFLNIQYRMPPQIGQIISDAVYDSQLGSNPLHPVTDKVIACHFVNVPGSERPDGTSFMNQPECDVVLQLAQHLQDQEKSYQIITPYEGQRSTIEETMRNTPGLDWENKCFNVDSFQGNEEDYIVISLVRSRELGFLKNLRRTNVMLTRCKKGMFIISSHKFLNGIGSETLVGTLMKKMGPNAWLEVGDIEQGKF